MNFLTRENSDNYYLGSGSSAKAHRSSGGSYSSGYGSSCCPLVIDPMTLLALLGFLAAAVYLLNELIAMSMLMMARRRKRQEPHLELFMEGKEQVKVDYSQQVTHTQSLECSFATISLKLLC